MAQRGWGPQEGTQVKSPDLPQGLWAARTLPAVMSTEEPPAKPQNGGATDPHGDGPHAHPARLSLMGQPKLSRVT